MQAGAIRRYAGNVGTILKKSEIFDTKSLVFF